MVAEATEAKAEVVMKEVEEAEALTDLRAAHLHHLIESFLVTEVVVREEEAIALHLQVANNKENVITTTKKRLIINIQKGWVLGIQPFFCF